MTTSQLETLRDTINDALQVITNASKQINQAPDPYAELKKAHAEGKVIQYRDDHMDAWVDCISPIWVNDTDATPNPRYRIKPEEPKLVPLGPDDVRCGDEIIVKDNVDGIRCGVAWVRNEGVQIYCVGHKTFKSLMDGYLIRRRDSDTFEPCSKEAAE